MDKQVLWQRAALWLLLLGPFFFLSYGFANQWASQQEHVGHMVFEWEQSIPFLPWTILPYWSIDLLYGLSFFICTSQKELDVHGKRLLTAQIIAVSCFILFPMAFSFEKPEVDGLFGGLFAALAAFDQPFNQAPSLHIALLVILWVLYNEHLPSYLHWPFYSLCFLTLISVLTTYQHHFIDIPTGVLLGWFCVWLWPKKEGFMFQQQGVDVETSEQNKRRRYIGLSYACLALILTLIAAYFGGTMLWLYWPAVSLYLVALCYLYTGVRGFQKESGGKRSAAAIWLFLPYLLAAWINSRLWTRHQPQASQIEEGIYLGRYPSPQDIKKYSYRSIIDVTAEFSKNSNESHWIAIPSLDLLTPPIENLMQAVRLIESRKAYGGVLVSCALGYSRSAVVILAWLILTRRASDVETAIQMVKRKRDIVITASDCLVLNKLLNHRLEVEV